MENKLKKVFLVPGKKDILVFYIDVGTLSPTKVSKYIENLRESATLKPVLDRLAKDYEILLIPVRPGGATRVEMLTASREPSLLEEKWYAPSADEDAWIPMPQK